MAPTATSAEALDAEVTKRLGDREVYIMTTKWWHESVYMQVMKLPSCLEGRCKFFRVEDETGEKLQASIVRFRDLLKDCTQETFPVVVTMTDNAMYVFAKAASDLGLSGTHRGASWGGFVACTHKVLTRSVVEGAGGVPFRGITSKEAVVPAMEGVEEVIVKPALGIGSLHIHKLRPGDANPFLGVENPCNMIDLSGGDSGAASLVPAEMMEMVGICEEYIDFSWKRVSCDGFVHAGKMVPWAITDNVYLPAPDEETFDLLMTPTNALTEEEQGACWKTLATIVKSMNEKYDYDNQFVCAEFFVKGDVAKVMEINPRISANQAPCFAPVFEGGDFVLATVCLQVGLEPPVPTRRGNHTAVALYRDPIKGCPAVVNAFAQEDGGIAEEVDIGGCTVLRKDFPQLMYYDRLAKDAHVYCTAATGGPDESVRIANKFYECLIAKHSGLVGGARAGA